MQIILPLLEGAKKQDVIHRKNGIVSQIYLDLGDGDCFPYDDWFDLPSIILNWWTANLKVQEETGEVQRNSFMDGPYTFVVSRLGQELDVKGVCSRFDDSEEERFHIQIPLSEYVEALKGALEKLIEVYDRFPDFQDDELPKLRVNLEWLKTHFAEGFWEI